MLIKRGKHDFLIGASWHMSQDKSDLRELMQANTGKSRVMLMANEAAWIGFDPDGKKPAIAAALAFAAVFPDLLIVEHLPDDRFWLCAIHQGMPAPGRDLVVEATEVRSCLLEWINFFPSAAIYGDVEGALGSAEAAWQRVLDAIKSKEVSPQQVRNFKVKRVLTKVDIAKIVGGFGLIVGIGVGAWHFNSASNEAESAAQRAAREAQEEREREIARKVETHKSQLVGMRAEVAQMKGRDTLRSWLEFFERQPYQVKGYTPAKLTCTVTGAAPMALPPMVGVPAGPNGVPQPPPPGMVQVLPLPTAGAGPLMAVNPTQAQPLGSNGCEVEWQAVGNVALMSSDRFLLDQTASNSGASQPSIKQIIPQVGVPTDFVRTVQHIVPDLPLVGVEYAPAATQPSVERVRSSLIDVVRLSSGGAIDLMIGITVPMVVPGVPDAQIPNVTVAHRGELNISINGLRALFDAKHVSKKLTEKAAVMGVYLRWTSMKVNSSLKADNIAAKAEYFVLEPQ